MKFSLNLIRSVFKNYEEPFILGHEKITITTITLPPEEDVLFKIDQQ